MHASYTLRILLIKNSLQYLLTLQQSESRFQISHKFRVWLHYYWIPALLRRFVCSLRPYSLIVCWKWKVELKFKSSTNELFSDREYVRGSCEQISHHYYLNNFFHGPFKQPYSHHEIAHDTQIVETSILFGYDHWYKSCVLANFSTWSLTVVPKFRETAHKSRLLTTSATVQNTRHNPFQKCHRQEVFWRYVMLLFLSLMPLKQLSSIRILA